MEADHKRYFDDIKKLEDKFKEQEKKLKMKTEEKKSTIDKKKEYELQVKITQAQQEQKEIVEKYEKIFKSDKKYGMVQANKILNNKVIMNATGEKEFKIMVEQGFEDRLNELRDENKLLKEHLLYFQRDLAHAVNQSLSRI